MTHRTILLYALALTLMTAPGCRGKDIKAVDHKPLAELAAAIKGEGYKRLAQSTQEVWSVDSATNEAVLGRPASLMLTTNEGTGEWTVSVFHDDTVGSTLLIGRNLVRSSDGASVNRGPFDRTRAQQTIKKLEACGLEFYPEAAQRLVEKLQCRRVFSGDVTFMLPGVLDAAYAAHRHNIDVRILDLTVRGKQVQITQGALREVMTERMTELQKQRADLDPAKGKSGSGGSPQPTPTKPDFGKGLEPAFADVFLAPNGQFAVLVSDRDGACVTAAVGSGFQINP